jgi:fido (protein-threonine AMPylation protein)
MALSPGYGETPLDFDELSALLPKIREALGEPVTKAAVYDLEQAVAKQVAARLRDSLDNALYRWEHTDDWTARQFGVAVHAETVRIHPFADGNGRSTRLLADLVFAAAQGTGASELYDWDVDKRHYIDLLARFDATRDPTELAQFIPTLRFR